ncbi:MAG: PTS sugar transporter subunit IIA [Hespellia sp.]|nr:PTS sugar transporter subunit IIA [Hespellia sp.]
MKAYKQSEVNPDVPGIILLSHGPFAVSLVESSKMILGEVENIAAYSLEPGDDFDKYREAFSESIHAFPAGCIIMVDLYGGTPCNQVMLYVQEKEEVLEVVTGMNLPMLIDAAVFREAMAGKELTSNAVDNGKDGIQRIDVEGFLSEDDDEDE